MKYIKYILLLSIVLFCETCKKDEPVCDTLLKIKSVNYDITTQDAIVTCILETDASFQRVLLEYSTDATFAETNQEEMEKMASQDMQYQTTLYSLTKGTTYYIRIRAINKYSIGTSATESFSTPTTSLPRVISSPAFLITSTTATCGGKVTINGGSSITERGVCYSRSPNPDIFSSPKTNVGGSVGAFTCKIANLVENTTYYARAYAKNSKGVAYGEEIQFSTNISSNIILYTSTQKLPVATSFSDSGFHPNAFEGNSVVSHDFDNGEGVIVFSDPLTSIGENAFYNCRNMKSVEMPNTVISIGHRAFNGCASLTHISIPSSIQSMGMYPFSNCTALQSVVWNAANCTTYDDGEYVYPPFQGNKSITSFRIGSNVIKLPRGLCYGLPISSIDIPSSVTEIGTSAFRECTSLSSVDIPYFVIEIGNSAFRNCTSLSSIDILCQVTKLEAYVFCECINLSSVYIPSSVTEIGSHAFEKCKNLSSIWIHDEVTSIGSFAFSECTGLKYLDLGSSLKEIGDYAFWNCSGLKSIDSDAPTPPTCGANVFYGVDKSIPVYVISNAAVSRYKAATGWKDFTNIQSL